MPRKWCPTIARIATVAIAVIIANSASATVRITDDYGGVIGDYLARFKAVRDSGERVIFDGLCLSACTLVLGIVPQDHICVTSRARLGFHAAWRSATGSLKATGSLQVSADDGTQLLMGIYPEHIRNWIARRGGLTSRIIYLGGRELTAMYRPCA